MYALIRAWGGVFDSLAPFLFLVAIPATAIVVWKEWGDWRTILLAIVALVLSSSAGQLLLIPLIASSHNRAIEQMSEGEFEAASNNAGIGNALLTLGGLIRVAAAIWLIWQAVKAF